MQDVSAREAAELEEFEKLVSLATWASVLPLAKRGKGTDGSLAPL
jgi:hypothetical protein